MKKPFLRTIPIVTSLLLSNMLQAQTTGTYVVADRSNRMASCQDTSITLADIFRETGIRDLNDPNDDVSKYEIKRLDGSLITEDVITNLKYSDYKTIYVDKVNTPFNGHNGLVIYLDTIHAPTSLFKKDTLKYTIEKGASVNFSQDFFNNFEFWSSGKDTEALASRMFFIDETNPQPQPVSEHWKVGKGQYKVKVKVAVCDAQDIFWDSIAVIVTETPCSFVEIKDLPSACRDQVVDLTPYVRIDGMPASAAQLAQLTFWDRSNIFSPATGVVLDPHAVDLATMYNTTDRSPNIEVAYQANVSLGVCVNYFYRPALKVPSKFIYTTTVFVKDNAGMLRTLQIDGDYYAFNGSFKKDILQQLYIAPYHTMEGTTFTFYNGTQPVANASLSPGAYKVVAKHPNCATDSSVFDINVKDRDFDIVWKSAQSQGKGYYTFTADEYSNATYAWSVWGGSIVAGLGTREITVYFSEDMSPAITAQCFITLPGARRAGASNTLGAAVYLNVKEGKSLDEIVTDVANHTMETSASVAYPNPTADGFALSGQGHYSLKVYNPMGQLVLQNDSYEANSLIRLKAKGMYLVHMAQQGQVQMLKVTVE